MIQDRNIQPVENPTWAVVWQQGHDDARPLEYSLFCQDLWGLARAIDGRLIPLKDIPGHSLNIIIKKSIHKLFTHGDMRKKCADSITSVKRQNSLLPPNVLANEDKCSRLSHKPKALLITFEFTTIEYS